MATSGSFKTSEAAGYSLSFSWNLESQDVAANTSKIAWTITLNSTSGYPCLFTSGQLLIDGTVVYQRGSGLVAAGATVASGTTSIAHASDGSKTFTATVTGSADYFELGITGTKSYALPSIARASQISAAGNVSLGNKCSIKWTPANSSFKYKLKFSLGGWSYTTDFISPGTTAAYTYAGYVIPFEVAEQIPNSKTGKMDAVLYTYTSGGTQIGSSSSQFTVTVPESLGPKAVCVFSPNEDFGGDFSGLYIQGKSKILADFTDSKGQYGAEIVSCALVIGGTSHEADSEGFALSDYLFASGELSIRGVVTDTRGYSLEVSETINVLQYGNPAVIPFNGFAKVICSRENSTELLISCGRKYSKLSVGGVQKNFCVLGYRIAASGTSFPSGWIELLGKDDTEDEISVVPEDVALAKNASYSVQIRATDDLSGEHILNFSITTDEVTCHFKKGGKAVAFGKYAEEDEIFDVAWDARFRNGINNIHMESFSLSTTKFSLDLGNGAQTLLLFGKGVLGTIYYNGTSTTWSGTGSVSCSNSGTTVTVTVPAAGTYSVLADGGFGIL